MAKWETIEWSSVQYKGVAAERLPAWFRALVAAESGMRAEARAALRERLCADANGPRRARRPSLPSWISRRTRPLQIAGRLWRWPSTS